MQVIGPCLNGEVIRVTLKFSLLDIKRNVFRREKEYLSVSVCFIYRKNLFSDFN